MPLLPCISTGNTNRSARAFDRRRAYIRCSSGIQQMTPIHLLARESVSWRKRPVAAAVSLACPTTPNEHLKMLQLQVAISHAQNPHVTHTTHLHATSVLLLCRVGAIGTWTATAPRRPLLSQTMRLCFLNIMWGATKKTWGGGGRLRRLRPHPPTIQRCVAFVLWQCGNRCGNVERDAAVQSTRALLVVLGCECVPCVLGA